MSEELVNQLTLNFLISKSQLNKLNKKIKETSDERKIEELNKYRDKIQALFNQLLVLEHPNDLLFDVKNAFDLFVEKSIYYFKSKENEDDEKEEKQDIKEDIDFEKEINDIDNGNYEEQKDDLEEEQEDDLEEEQVTIVREKKKRIYSNSVDDIQKLPLNWFENVRRDYQKNKIIPRKKE